MGYVIRVETSNGTSTLHVDGQVPNGQHVIYGGDDDGTPHLVAEHRADDGRFTSTKPDATEQKG